VEEVQLLEKARRKDADAERGLYERHVDRVYYLAYRMTGDETMAQDITQDTFIKAFDKLDSFRGDSKFSTWLHRIATTVTLNALRKVKKFRLEGPMELADNVGAGTVHAEPDLTEKLYRAIDSLPERYRTVVVMHDVEGYKHQEIAGALGIEVGTSKAQLSRARAQLREMLSDFAGEWAL